MISDLIAAIFSAAVGVGVAFVNYLLSKTVLVKNPQKYSFVTVLRLLIQIGFLVVVYFIGQKTEYDPMYLLIGAALGMTLPMIVFTKKLLRYNESLHQAEERKEEETDG